MNTENLDRDYSGVDYDQWVSEYFVDLMHFLTSLALAAGLSADEFHRLYTAKHRVNEQRQESGYSRQTKDEKDNKAII